MTNRGGLVTLGELLDEHAEVEQDDEILDRIKVLAQENLPEGWTHWEVATCSKEEIFGEKIEPCTLNKLIFALPTVGLARAFNPDADHLSEKGYREMRLRLLDWSFTRALIMGPPAVANRVRGSAARTELFKQSVESMRPLLHTRAEADRILSGCLSETVETNRKRRSTSSTSQSHEPLPRRRRLESPSPSTSRVDDRFEALERKMEGMFSLLLEKFEHREQSESDSENASDFSEEEVNSYSPSWRAPDLDPVPDLGCEEGEVELLPAIKEADPLVPEPSAQLKKEGIECLRLGSTGWNRIRYKEVEKHLHAASVFSALKVNTELGTLSPQPSAWLTKQEGFLGTIAHGLLLQRKALAEGVNTGIKRCPGASAELRNLVSEDSKLRTISDQLLQFVCGHRAETIDLRRKTFKAKNETLNAALQNIPPSASHLFDEKQLSSFLKDNGGAPSIFASQRAIDKREPTFRKPAPPTKVKGRKATAWALPPLYSLHLPILAP